MPTYVCTARDGALTKEQKAQVAAEITRVHNEVTGAPRFFVQVLFNDLKVGNQFIGGVQPLSDQVWIRGDIRAGRSEHDKGRLLLDILRGFSRISGVPEADVWVYLTELPAKNMAEFGQVLPEPGAEDAWLAALPQAEQGRLRKMGVGADFKL
jgi:phenylpyruvate tautomerase PptA (4-oxalocrotonate tautomerase family)